MYLRVRLSCLWPFSRNDGCLSRVDTILYRFDEDRPSPQSRMPIECRMTVQERREMLLEWLQWRSYHTYSSREIVNNFLVYDYVKHREARCFDDLKVLEAEDRVRRLPGRPARWGVV